MVEHGEIPKHEDDGQRDRRLDGFSIPFVCFMGLWHSIIDSFSCSVIPSPKFIVLDILLTFISKHN